MKRLLVILFVAISFVSCRTKEEIAISEYQSLYEELKTHADECTSEEYNQFCDAYDQMELETEECEFSREQNKTLKELKGRIFAILLKIKVRLAVDELDGAIENSSSFLEGIEDEFLESEDIH